MLGYHCVLLMVKAVVVLLSWDVRLPLCIVDSQSSGGSMLDYLCVLLIVKAVVVLLSKDVRLPLCIVDGQSCSKYCSRGMLGYLCVLLMVKAVVTLYCSRGMLGYLFVLFDGQSCSSTALVGCQVTFVYC